MAAPQSMRLANSYLQGSREVLVMEFTPAEPGGEGTLHIHCETSSDYTELRRFLDEPHGSALLANDGGRWFLRRLSDNGQPERGFPRGVTVAVELLDIAEH